MADRTRRTRRCELGNLDAVAMLFDCRSIDRNFYSNLAVSLNIATTMLPKLGSVVRLGMYLAPKRGMERLLPL